MMRTPQGICILRHISRCQRSILSYTRHGSSSSRQPYILPRLAIDLDAHDNPYVRPATEEDYAVNPKPSRHVPHEQLLIHNAQMRKEDTQTKDAQPNPLKSFALNIRAITAPDLMAYALLGNPNAMPTSGNLALREQFQKQKVHALDNADTKIKRLVYDFSTDESKVLENAGFTSEREELIAHEIRNLTSFSRFKRMIEMLSSTVKGCEFLNKNGAVVVEGIRHCRESQEPGTQVRAGWFLRVLNNLLLNTRSKGVRFGPDLCLGGLYYASRSLDLPSVREYLGIFQAFKHHEYNGIGATLWAIQSAMKALIIGHRRWTREDQEERNVTVLTLLTGWASGGVPSNAEKRQPCFASISREFLPFAEWEYSMALGYVGARDALWYEWQQHYDNKHLRASAVKNSPSVGSSRDMNVAQRVELFALAFLMAEDHTSALQVLGTLFNQDGQYIMSVQPPDSPLPPEELLGDFWDAKDKLAASEEYPNLEDIAAKPKSGKNSWVKLWPDAPPKNFKMLMPLTCQKILWYYKAKNTTSTTKFRNQLETCFLPDKSETFLKIMSDFLVPEWIKFKRSRDAPFDDKYARYVVDWVEHKGVEGVVIRKGNEIVHFKPSSWKAN